MDRRGFLRSGAAAGAGLLASRAGFSGPLINPGRRPNIIVVLCDDLGYGDIGCYGQELIRTPNVDSLARRGIRLTDFYSSAPVCSPSRAGLITGRYPPRTGISQVLFPTRGVEAAVNGVLLARGVPLGLPRDEVTIAKVLSQAGYATCQIGKWHLGDRRPHLPSDHGFQHYFGLPYSNDMIPLPLIRNGKVVEKSPVDQDYLTRNYTEEALWFIKENKDHPFFIYFCHTFPHVPLHASPEFRGKSRAGLYGDCVEEIDWSVGKVLEALDSCGLAENTLLMFTSDNGPWWTGDPGDHRGRKNDTFDGGMAVPLVASWPEQIPAGTVSNQPAMNIDIFATSLAAAGAPLPSDRVIDGQDLLPLLSGKDKKSPHEFIYFYKGKDLQAVRMDNWKYQLRHYVHYSPMGRPQGPWLFDLARDGSESYNLIDLRPEVAAEFEKQIAGWEKSFGRGIRR